MNNTTEVDNMFDDTGDTDVEASQERHLTDDEKNLQKPADGGLKSWLTVLGAACVYFSTLGYSNSFGVFQQYYETHQLRANSPDDIAWIGSLANYLQFGVGAITGAIFDRQGPMILYPAAVLYVFSFMMISLCKTYWQFMLAQGVLLGLTQGAMVVPATAAVTQHFHNKRGLALGLTVAGSSIGGIVLPIMMSKMLNDSDLGFGWSVRIMGFVLVPPMSIACFTIRPHHASQKIHFSVQEAIKNHTYTMGIASMFIILLGMYTPIYYLPSFAVAHGMSPTLASYLLAIFNGSSTVGRILPGMVADKVGHLNVYALAGISTGIITLCWSRATSNAGILVYTAFIGFTSGTILSAAAASFAVSVKDARQTGVYMGAAMAIASLASLIGPPINGVLLREYGGYTPLTIFSGVACIVGGFMGVLRKATLPQGLLGRV